MQMTFKEYLSYANPNMIRACEFITDMLATLKNFVNSSDLGGIEQSSTMAR